MPAATANNLDLDDSVNRHPEYPHVKDYEIRAIAVLQKSIAPSANHPVAFRAVSSTTKRRHDVCRWLCQPYRPGTMFGVVISEHK